MATKTNRKILVVEDNPNMSSLLADMLEVFSVDSVRATDGQDALKRLNEEHIGLVISDLRMPNMTGTELLVAIKEMNPSMPVILISGFTIDASDDKELISKADGFLHKPFKMNDIKDILEKHFHI